MSNEKLFALFKNDKRISKAHSTREAAFIEAFERGVVIDYSADFIGDKSGRTLMEGYEVREFHETH